MTNIELQNTLLGIHRVKTKELPARVAFAITRNLRKLQPIVEDYEATRLDIIVKYGGYREDESKATFTVPTENIEIVNQELSNLDSMEVQDMQFSMISISDLDSMQLSVEEMNAIYPMISEEE